VVTIEQLPVDMDLDGCVEAGLGQLEPALQRWLLLDLEQTEIGGRPAHRTLGHHLTEMGAVTMEQWTLVEAALGYTLTASVGTLEYVELADLFTTMEDAGIESSGAVACFHIQPTGFDTVLLPLDTPVDRPGRPLVS
jgi:hypothetical protein